MTWEESGPSISCPRRFNVMEPSEDQGVFIDKASRFVLLTRSEMIERLLIKVETRLSREARMPRTSNSCTRFSIFPQLLLCMT